MVKEIFDTWDAAISALKLTYSNVPGAKITPTTSYITHPVTGKIYWQITVTVPGNLLPVKFSSIFHLYRMEVNTTQVHL
jgi:hypothetical protein